MNYKELDTSIVEAFKELDTSSLTDALDKQGIDGGLLGIKAVVPGTRLCGQALPYNIFPAVKLRGL